MLVGISIIQVTDVDIDKVMVKVSGDGAKFS